MVRPASERALVEVVVGFLQSQGYRARTEVPALGRSIDVVATRGRWLTAIEVKLHDWPKALEQCRPLTLVADFVCVAIGTRSVPAALSNRCRALGIGVVGFDAGTGAIDWALQPKWNKNVWRPERQRLAKRMKEIEHAH